MNIYLFVNRISAARLVMSCELYQYEKEENNSIHFRIAPNFESINGVLVWESRYEPAISLNA